MAAFASSAYDRIRSLKFRQWSNLCWRQHFGPIQREFRAWPSTRVPHHIVMLIDSKRANDVLLDGLRVEQEMIIRRAISIGREGAVAADL